MKRLIIFVYCLIIAVFFTACAINNSMLIAPSASINKSNFKIVKNVIGTSKSSYILGIGGLNQNGLINEAKLQLYENAKLKNNQLIGNVTLDEKITYIFTPIYYSKTVIMTADIIEFFSDNNDNLSEKHNSVTKNNENILSKENNSVVDESLSSEEKAIQKIISSSTYVEFKYNNNDEVNIGDYIKFTTQYGDKIYGIIAEKTNTKKVKIKYYSPSHSILYLETNWKDIVKIIEK